MKNLLVCSAVVFFCLGCEKVCAQINLNNPKTYGIWQWLSPPVSKKTYPEIRGRMYAAKWADIEPSPNVWKWTEFDKEIEERITDYLPIIFKVYTKEDAPMWLYSNGVPKVIEKDNTGAAIGWAPYYADNDYKFYFKRMVTAVRKHIETYPSNIRNYIIGVQGCYGSTGDYIGYKGNVDAQYQLTTIQFADLFKEFSLYYYNEYANTNPRIYIVSNPSFNAEDNFEWVAANMPGSWFKCSNMSKGYQLNGEKSKSAWLYPILNEPLNNGSYVRARSEITNDGLLTGWWEEMPYKNMLAVMCYAIHWGLDWSNQGPNQFNDHLNDTAFFFFNKYAGQKNPLTATNAMCYLKDVIDASDATRFPASTYGAVVQTAARFNSVLQPFIPYGAKLEDVSNAMKTEYENIHARGINDVGWDLFPGNYERYIHQLNANTTSIGYWNVSSANSNSIYGRFARGFAIEKNKTALYFDLDNGFLGNRALNGAYPVTIEITYLDYGTGSWQLYYDSKSYKDKLAYTVNCTNTNLWKKKTITLADAYFGNRASSGSDFYIRNTAGNTKNVIFSMVELSRTVTANSLTGLYSSSVANFDTLCVNSVSQPKALMLSGSGLTSSNITIGPKEGFSFSLTNIPFNGSGVASSSIPVNAYAGQKSSVKSAVSSGNLSARSQNECGTPDPRFKIVTTQREASSNIAAVTESGKVSSHKMAIIPNPVQDIATLQFYTENSFTYSVKIADMTGKIVLIKKGTALPGIVIERLDVQKLVTGQYFVTLINSKGEKETLKLMKQ